MMPKIPSLLKDADLKVILKVEVATNLLRKSLKEREMERMERRTLLNNINQLPNYKNGIGILNVLNGIPILPSPGGSN